MSRKTLALLVSLLLVTVVLLGLAISSSKKQPTQQATPQDTSTTGPEPTSAANTTLTMSPTNVTMNADGTGTVDVQVTTDSNKVSAVQLELSYDPKALTNVKITPGTYFASPLVLINTNDTKTGRISYALGVAQQSEAHTGTGSVATITFRKVPGALGSESRIDFLPKTLVTEIGVKSSVLKTSTGATVQLTPNTNQPVQ